MNTASPEFDTFRRHQFRRAAGVPTVTALVGPTGLGVRVWRQWAGANGRPCAVAASADSPTLLAAWASAAFAATSPADRACAWLAAVLARPAEDVTRDAARMTRFDLDTLWRSLPVGPHTPAATAAHLLLAGRIRGEQPSAAGFVRHLAGAADDTARVVRAVADLYPPDAQPALLLVRPGGAADTWGYDAGRALERFAAAAPTVPVAVALAADDYAAVGARYPNSRAAALVREGFVELRGVSGNELEERLRTAGVDPLPPAATIRRLTADGLADDVAEAFVTSARAVQSPTPEERESDFRSVHEEFLFGALESMPPTAGLFRPNAPPDFRHGPRAAESDLLAAALKLVVEVDGGYYHLNVEQYRRDRRKDWLYQQNGYFVLRFLAEDVVSDLERILDTILEAVALRRTSAQPTGAA